MKMPNFSDIIWKHLSELHADAKQAEEGLQALKDTVKYDSRGRLANKAAMFGAKKAAVWGTGQAVAMVIPATKVATGITPITWAVQPYFSALSIHSIGCDLDKLYAVMGETNTLSNVTMGSLLRNESPEYVVAEKYECTCKRNNSEKAFISWDVTRHSVPVGCIGGRVASYNTGPPGKGQTCQEIRDFYVSQKEKKALKYLPHALPVVGTVGYLSWVAIRGLYKRCKGTIHQKRDQAAMDLICNALPVIEFSKNVPPRLVRPGCRRAQALIALFFNELDLKNPKRDPFDYRKTICTLLYPNGFYSLSTAFSAATLSDAPNYLRKKTKAPKHAKHLGI